MRCKAMEVLSHLEEKASEAKSFEIFKSHAVHNTCLQYIIVYCSVMVM